MSVALSPLRVGPGLGDLHRWHRSDLVVGAGKHLYARERLSSLHSSAALLVLFGACGDGGV
ncbi:MAG: hypothetical protein C7B45_08890 [Sulfobacillus acidophilus]|uniref:Uncharacterized protein n=1 Tax=Sulfobacillus acidophilus TaxID=53633 RepID=A0A2T2WI22_9FIRM|nr:MAG: hypothetical protein C7B45_08890 [Sulfobacillus acidophilus]